MTEEQRKTLSELIIYIARKTAQAQSEGDAVCERFTADEIAMIGAGLVLLSDKEQSIRSSTKDGPPA